MHNLVEVKELYKIYKSGPDEVRALDGVSFSIQQGEMAAVVGASGSGKSTLMNILGCLDTPSKGLYRLDGQDVGRLSDRKLSGIRNKKIGFIFQGFNLVSSLSALENVELPLLYRGVPRAKRRQLAEAALRQVGLAQRMHHRPAELSGGQQQRVAIARAIAARPPIILADEPTGNLDSKAGGQIMEILRELHADGRTVILITHDPAIADSIPRQIRMLDGKVLADSGGFCRGRVLRA
ncbi:MAG: ABC transporter ATP-binding protein [Clostridiales bacterium]|nr:ABC transporter ATP-binding protein [Clostridiales bacterium]